MLLQFMNSFKQIIGHIVGHFFSYDIVCYFKSKIVNKINIFFINK